MLLATQDMAQRQEGHNLGKARLIILLVLLFWGCWHVFHSLKTGEAPGPPFDVYRETSPGFYWFLTITFAGFVILGAVALVTLARVG